MAMTARASQEQSKETAFEGKLERAQRSRDDLEMEMRTLRKNAEKSGGEELEANSAIKFERRGATYLSARDVLLMQQEVQVLQRQVRSLARSLRLPSMPEGDDVNTVSKEKSNSSDGDLGFLADILHFSCGDEDMSSAASSSNSSSSSSQYIVALDVILGSKLCVKVCRDGAAAELIMAAQNRSQGGAQASRIWPIDRLTTAPTRSKPFLEILRKYGDIAIDPATLVRISYPAAYNSCHNGLGGPEAPSVAEDSSMQKVLLKALESWIIVQGDDAATRIIQDRALSRHINGVVTMDGNKHTLGSLTVGFGGRRLSGRENGYPEVQVALQIKYRRLKSALESLEGQLSVFDSNRREEDERTWQSSRMADLDSLLVTSERAVEEMEISLSTQSEKAALAHRWAAQHSTVQHSTLQHRRAESEETPALQSVSFQLLSHDISTPLSSSPPIFNTGSYP
jgi:hypothetical protein